jgi:hypothetical protein
VNQNPMNRHEPLNPLNRVMHADRMTTSRRDFLFTSGAALGAAALPAWALELEAAEAAAIDKRELADVALTEARRLGASYTDIRINVAGTGEGRHFARGPDWRR